MNALLTISSTSVIAFLTGFALGAIAIAFAIGSMMECPRCRKPPDSTSL